MGRSRVSRDELLTTIMIYWVTQTMNFSIRLYYKATHQSAAEFKRIEFPTGLAVFPVEIPAPPRSLAQHLYNIQRWTRVSAGGHFAALEQPQALIEDIRAFFRLRRHTRERASLSTRHVNDDAPGIEKLLAQVARVCQPSSDRSQRMFSSNLLTHVGTPLASC